MHDETNGVECRTCNGTGEIVDNNGLEHTCSTCGGSGYVEPGLYDPEGDE